MWPLGQAMKIAHMNKNSEKETLNQLLNNYGDTPHTATGLPPAAMLFRDGKWTVFPRKIVTCSDVSLARERDKQMTQERTGKINTSKYKKQDQINVGDKALIRNHTKQCKFDPLFLAQPYSVIDGNRNYVTVTNDAEGRTPKRHRDNLKLLPFDTQILDELAKCRDSDSNTSYYYRSRYDRKLWGLC